MQARLRTVSDKMSSALACFLRSVYSYTRALLFTNMQLRFSAPSSSVPVVTLHINRYPGSDRKAGVVEYTQVHGVRALAAGAPAIGVGRRDGV